MDDKTTPEYLISNANDMPDEPALSWKDDSGNWVTLTWSDFYDSAMSVARSLISMGFEPGDKLSFSWSSSEAFAKQTTQAKHITKQ